MRTWSRRSILSALGISLPFGLSAGARAATKPVDDAPVLKLRSFEEAVRAAFADGSPSPSRRVEVGHSEQIRAGVQGCHNDRPFAGFAAGQLRIVRTGAEPGPAWQGVRLYVGTVDIIWTGRGSAPDLPSRPLDFASLPPAPRFG